jgi:predicted PurR-regulated permease PerM
MPNQIQPNGPDRFPDAPAQPGRREAIPASSSRVGLAGFAWRVVVAVLILALAYLMWRGVQVLLLAFAGVLFAVFLSALSGWLSRRTGIRYGWALAAVVAGLVLLTGGLGCMLANVLAAQAAELSQKLPQALRQIQEYLEATPWGRLVLEKAPRAAESFAEPGVLWQVTGLVSGAAGFLVAIVVIVFVGIFGAAEPAVYKEGLLHLVPPDSRGRAAQAVDAITFNLRGWLVGQAFLMVMIGVTTAAGLWLLGIPLALTLGLIAGILELVPYIGAWLSAVPAALIALLLGPWYLVMTLALYLGLHILEGYVLVPLVQRRAVHLPPALTLVAQVLLGDLLGVLGLVVAAPLTVAAVVLVKMLYVEDALGDQTVQVPGAPRKATPPVPGDRATVDWTSPLPDK